MGLNDGLEALYHFTGDVTDSSGNGNNATNNGATLTTDKESVSNQAYDFDGTNDYMDTNYQLGSIYSISSWAYFPTYGSSRNICGVRDATGSAGTRGFQIQHSSSNTYFVQFYNSSNGSAGSLTGSIIEGQFNHVLLTRNGDDVEIYINGVLSDTDSSSTKNTPSQNLILGRLGNQSLQYWNDKIDEVRIYNRAITPFEVYQLYQGYDTTASSVGTLNSELEALYHFTGDATDSSGNGNDGTVSGATLTTDKESVSNQAYDYDGTNDYIDTTLTVIPAKGSINMWAKSNSSSDIILTGAYDLTRLFYIRYSGGSNNWEFYFSSGSGILSATINLDFEDATWHQITLSWDLDNDELIFYYDGAKQSISYSTQTTPGTFTLTKNIYIGARNNNSTPDLDFNGKIDEFRFYNRVLSNTEALMLFQGYDSDATCEETLSIDNEALYHFTGDATDDSGNGNNLTVNGATLTTDKESVSNQAYSYDGTNDYLNRTNFTELGVSNVFSISSWFKSDVTSSTDCIVTNSAGSTDRLSINVQGNAVRASVYNGSYHSKSVSFTDTTNWHHVVMCWDGTNTTAYLDGVEMTGTTDADLDSTAAFNIGRTTTGLAYFDGKIDEVRVYSRALTQDEINNLYFNYDVPETCPVAPSSGIKSSFFFGGGL